MKYTAIVLAAGTGSRMHSSVRKQYMELCGHPVLYYSLAVFENSFVDDIILVTGAQDIGYCQNQIVEKYGFTKVHKVISGGKERYLSVYEGLCAVQDADYVLIHDGARPLVDQEILERTLAAAKKYGSGVAAVPVKDTIKVADREQFAIQTPSRNTLWTIQTPQTFSYAKIKAAYDKVLASEDSRNITDDAMVLELASGEKVKLTEGSYQNLKVTTPEDLLIAEAFLHRIEKQEHLE